MTKDELTKADVDWNNPDSLAALFLTAKAVDNAAQAGQRKSPTPKGGTQAATNSAKPKS